MYHNFLRKRSDGVDDYVAIIEGEGGEHERTFEAGDFMTASGDEEEDDGGANEHDEVDDFKAVWCDGAEKCNWKTEDDADIEDVATDNVADEEFVFATFRGFNGGDEFWEGSTEGDDGEGDDAVGNAD